MTSQKQIIFEAILKNDMITIDGLVQKTRLTQHMVSRRVSELADEGRVYVAGEIIARTGRNQSIWSVSPENSVESARKFRHNAKFRRWAKQASIFRQHISEQSYQDITRHLHS